MNIIQRHEWVLTAEEAIAIQQSLRKDIVTTDDFGTIRHVAGVDVGFEAEGRITRAAIAV